ncbi:MAG TPA: hypothetical protein DG754_08705 [Bacteroidales bacterium]|jgi:uncharacterized membrane protein|nr:hypothetical protein [Bacteroidales bacterium]
MMPNKRDLIVGGVLAIVITISVIAHTLWFGTIENPFNYTFSMIGNRFDRMTEFIIWGASTGFLLAFFILYLYRKASYKNRKSKRLLIYSNIFLVLTCATPAVKEINAFTHSLHTLFAILFGVSLSGSLFFFNKFLKSKNEEIYGKSALFLNVIIFGSLALLVVFGNSGIFELFFFLTLSTFLLVLNKWLDYLNIKD